MSVGFVIPFRGLKQSKTRLRAVLPRARVESLCVGMLTNVAAALRETRRDAPGVLITRCRLGLAAPDVTIIEEPLDLNDAIEFARTALLASGVDRILVASSDLPFLRPQDVHAILGQTASVVIASDASGLGTNGLVFPANEARFCRFGLDSAAEHAAEAKARGLSVASVAASGWARDIDTPDQVDEAVLAACAPNRGRA